MDNLAGRDRGPSLASRAEHGGCTVAVLSGDLDITSAPALREQILRLLSPAASRLIIDLSATRYADASGVAVLVSSARRARLLGGWLRLVSPAPEVARVLLVTGTGRHLAAFPTVQSAITGQCPDARPAAARVGPGMRRAAPARPVPASAVRTAGSGELRTAIIALLAHADAWRDADPRRRFTPAMQALARASVGPSDAALTRAAQSLLSVLAREPLTHSPQVAATASRLRRLLDPGPAVAVPAGLRPAFARPACGANGPLPGREVGRGL
jgi:anti-sigma B factor antagonist